MDRGEVWKINLDPTIGAEIKKTRPAVIVNDDGVGILPLRVIVPITDWKMNYEIASWMASVGAKRKSNSVTLLQKGKTGKVVECRLSEGGRCYRK